MDQQIVHIDAHLPDDDVDASALIEAAARLYGNSPLGVYYLNYLRKQVEAEDYPEPGLE